MLVHCASWQLQVAVISSIQVHLRFMLIYLQYTMYSKIICELGYQVVGKYSIVMVKIRVN